MSAEGKQQEDWHEESGEDANTSLPPEDKNTSDDSVVNWSASEYISPDKGVIWYILLVVVALGLISLDVFIMKSWTFTALVVVMTVAIIIYSNRPPREVQYSLSGDHGLYVGEKLHSLNEFKAFGMIKDGANFSIMLIPVKRFSVGVSVYFPQEAGEKIVDILGARLPMEDLKLDFIDRLVHRLRI